MWPTVFKYAAGITSVVSLASFLGALFVWLQARSKERSIVETIRGKGVVQAETVVGILKEFNTDEARLAALKKVLGYDQQRAAGVLDKVKPNIDVGRFSLTSQVQMRRRLVAAGIILIILAAIGTLWSRAHPNPAPPNNGPKPEVALRFVYSTDPALVIVNPSDAVARDIKWAVELWNTDLPDRDDPLPIPITGFDWIKPHAEGGPINLFDNALVSPLLKPGNLLVGSASVNCPECSRGRSYIVHIVWGEGGWVSEIKDETSGRLLVPSNFHKDFRKTYFKSLEAVPIKERIAIGER